MINDSEKLLREQDAAAMLAMSIKTLQAWRLRGGGPVFQKIGRSVRYSREAIQDFISAGTRHNTSE